MTIPWNGFTFPVLAHPGNGPLNGCVFNHYNLYDKQTSSAT